MEYMLHTSLAIICTRIRSNTPLTTTCRIPPILPLNQAFHNSINNINPILHNGIQLIDISLRVNTQEILFNRWPNTRTKEGTTPEGSMP